MEETIERIKVMEGVEGYVIADKDGTVLRRHPNTSQEKAEAYAEAMGNLTYKARGTVRDLNPRV